MGCGARFADDLNIFSINAPNSAPMISPLSRQQSEHCSQKPARVGNARAPFASATLSMLSMALLMGD
jgi:hypothetical protein